MKELYRELTGNYCDVDCSMIIAWLATFLTFPELLAKICDYNAEKEMPDSFKAIIGSNVNFQASDFGGQYSELLRSATEKISKASKRSAYLTYFDIYPERYRITDVFVLKAHAHKPKTPAMDYIYDNIDNYVDEIKHSIGVMTRGKPDYRKLVERNVEEAESFLELLGRIKDPDKQALPTDGLQEGNKIIKTAKKRK